MWVGNDCCWVEAEQLCHLCAEWGKQQLFAPIRLRGPIERTQRIQVGLRAMLDFSRKKPREALRKMSEDPLQQAQWPAIHAEVALDLNDYPEAFTPNPHESWERTGFSASRWIVGAKRTVQARIIKDDFHHHMLLKESKTHKEALAQDIGTMTIAKEKCGIGLEKNKVTICRTSLREREPQWIMYDSMRFMIEEDSERLIRKEPPRFKDNHWLEEIINAEWTGSVLRNSCG